MYMAEYEIKLGIGLNDTDFNAIKNKINSLKDETIKLKLDDSAVDTQIAGIKREIESLGKTKGLKFDTSALKNSLTSVKGDITEIKNLLNSLGNGANVKGLVSSINNIGIALDKVSGKFDELKADLNALSKKDFGININLDMGKNKTNPIKAMTDYGREARRNTIPQLQEQSAYLQNLLGGYQQADRALERYLVKIYKANGIKVKNNLIDDMADTSSLSKQMEAIEKYIGHMKKIASSQGVDLSGFDAQFSKAAEAIVDDTVKIQTGAKQTEESIESVGRELQKVFSSGIDGEKLSTQLDSIVTDLNEIKTTIQGLSSGVTLDGLLQSFDRLSNSIKELMTNARNIQDVLLNIGSSAGASNNLNNAIQTLKSSEKVLDNFKTSLKNLGMGDVEIDAVAERIKNLGVQINTLNQQKTLIPGKKRDKEILSVDISGLDKMGNAIKLTEQYDIATGKLIRSIDRVSTVQQKAGASANTFAKQQKDAVSNLTNEINKYYRAAIDQNANKPIKGTAHLNSLEDEYNNIISAIQRMGSASNDTFDEQKRTVKTLISEYQSLVREYKNAETVATSLRSKDISTVKDTYSSKLDVLISKMRKDGVYTSGFENGAENLRSILSGATDANGLVSFLNGLDKLEAGYKRASASVKEFNQAQKVGIKVSGLESKISDIQRISPEIDKFETEIAGAKVSVQSLLADLKQVKTQGDFSVINTKFKAFTDAAKASGIAVAETATEANKIYNEIYNTKKRIGSLEVDLIGAEAKGDTKTIKDINDEIKRLQTNLTSLDKDGAYSSKFTDKQKASLQELNKQIEYSKKQAQNQVDYKISMQDAKKEVKETEESFKRLKSLAKEMGQIDVKIAGLDADKDIDDIRSLQRILNELESEYRELYSVVGKNLSDSQVNELNQEFAKTSDSVRNLKKEMADIAEAQKITSDFEKLKSLAKEISNTRIDILKSDDAAEISEATAKLSRLNAEYDELLAKTRGSLSNKQIGELDNIVDQGDTNALKAFNNEVQEFIKLQNQIENKKFEIGKLELLGGKENEIADLKRQLAELEDTYNHLMNTFMKKVSGNADILQVDDFKGLENGIEKATANAENRLKQFEAQYADAKAKLAEDIKLDIDNGKFDNEVSAILDKFSKLSGESSELKEHIEAVDTALTKMKEAAGTDNEVADAEKLIAAQEEYAKAIKKVNNELNIQAREERAANAAEKLSQDRKSLKLDMVNWLKQNTKAAKEYGDEIQKLIASCDKLDKVGLASTRQKFNNITKDAELHGKTGLTTWDKLVDKVKEYSVYFSVADVAMRSIQALKDMFEQVKAIDTAMTELKKVTDESNASYDRFLTNAASRAKEIGTTIDGLVTSTADFARLGYGFEDAQGLAEVANIYAVVGDEIEGVEGATQSLVSTMAAFKDEMNGMSDSEFALSIVDKFNEVSNNFSISSGGIGEALTRSASSLATANNTLDESIALITAANTVVNLCHAA